MSIQFTAALAGANTAAKCLAVSSDGDAKLVLEVAASELGQVLRLLTLGQGKSFKVSIEE